MDTLVVRLWTPADPAELTTSDLRGTVAHVATGRCAAFADGPGLLAKMEQLRAAPARNPGREMSSPATAQRA